MEFNVIVYLSNPKASAEAERLEEMGIKIPDDNSGIEERIVKYAFDASNIVEIRETLSKFGDGWEPAISVTYMVKGKVFDTPPLLIEYQEFKKIINGNNKKSTETK